RLLTSVQMQFIALRRGTPGPLTPPVETLEGGCSPVVKAGVDEALACSVVGSPESARRGLERLIEEARPNELECTAQIYDHAARLRSFEITAEIRNSLSTNNW